MGDGLQKPVSVLIEELANDAATSFALKEYLFSAKMRDPADVLNELEVIRHLFTQLLRETI